MQPATSTPRRATAISIAATTSLDGGELFPGGSYQGNECRFVPLAAVEDGSLLVAITPMMSFSDPVFVALS